MRAFQIYTLTPNDINHQEDLVYELQKEIDGDSYDVNCYLNEEISKIDYGIFAEAKYLEVRAIDGHTIKRTTRVDCMERVVDFEANWKRAV